jgi:hypothetical protein
MVVVQLLIHGHISVIPHHVLSPLPIEELIFKNSHIRGHIPEMVPLVPDLVPVDLTKIVLIVCLHLILLVFVPPHPPLPVKLIQFVLQKQGLLSLFLNF